MPAHVLYATCLRMTVGPTSRVIFLASVAVQLSCGRAATRDDCDAMLKKHVELKLADESNVAVRAQKTAEYTQMLRSQVDACVGRKLTDGYLNCVKSALTEDALKACRKD